MTPEQAEQIAALQARLAAVQQQAAESVARVVTMAEQAYHTERRRSVRRDIVKAVRRIKRVIDGAFCEPPFPGPLISEVAATIPISSVQPIKRGAP
jgi:hypothetical protein